jgi:hypothetical protein
MTFSTKSGAKKRRSLKALYVGASLLAVYLAYFAFIQREENEARQTAAAMHESDSAHYLESVDAHQGFDAEYARIHDYSTPRTDVPPFLIGRWALFDAEKQVQESYIPEDCTDALVIEDGHVRLLDGETDRFDVHYSIVGDKVIADTAGGETIRIRPVAYTSHIHHLVVDLPGAKASVYAYLCK